MYSCTERNLTHIHGRPAETAPGGALAGLLLTAILCGGACSRPGAESDRPVSVIATCDTAGWIVPCGCASDQLGGLPRRATYVDQVRRSHDVLLIDAGGAPGGTSVFQRFKFDHLALGELAMQLEAHNLGAAEVRLGPAEIARMERRGMPWVSANTADTQGKPLVPASRVVIRGGRRILVTGVLAEEFSTPEIHVRTPARALLETISAAPSHDLLVVLAYVPQDQLIDLARQLPEADLMIGGPTGQSIPPQQAGRVHFAAVTQKGKFAAQFDRDAASGQWTGRLIELRKNFADDPHQERIVRTYYDQLLERDFTAEESGLLSAAAGSYPDGYRIAGTQACRECHAAATQVWEQSKHAHAWVTLEAKKVHGDPTCQSCHTTGYGLPGGFVSRRESLQQTAVGCESCHGPSAAHAARPTIRTPYQASEQCRTCHDLENSPEFDFAAYWPTIEHGQEPRPGEPRIDHE